MQSKHTFNKVASFVPKPVFIERRGRPQKGHESKPMLDASRQGIAKLRQRGFAWVEVYETLQRWGLKCTYPAFLGWMKRHY